jgi:histidinol phosphatase-like enzyme (inositol monophosphatase family)
MTPVPIADFAFLDRLADAADAVTLPLFRVPIAVEAKTEGDGDFDPVTEADRGAEAAMRAIIRAAFPDHGIEGEEFADLNTGASRVWHLDPIDGTRQYVTGMPLWGTLAGLTVDGSPTLGLISHPATGERFFGGDGVALYRGPRGEAPLRTRACASLASAALFTTSPHLYRNAEAEAFERLRSRVRLVRYGADCYAFALLALGLADVVIEAGLDDHDIVPIVPIVEAAGGIVVDWRGNRAVRGGDVVALGDPGLKDAVLAALAG